MTKSAKGYLGVVLALILQASVSAQVYTQLDSFDESKEGSNPNNPALLAQGQDGNLYGTLPFKTSFQGSIFVSSVSGVVAPLYAFPGLDGSSPQSGLRLGFDGNFYGTTEMGGDPGFESCLLCRPTHLLLASWSGPLWRFNLAHPQGR